MNGKTGQNKLPRMQDRQTKTRKKKQQVKQSESFIEKVESTFDCISRRREKECGRGGTQRNNNLLFILMLWLSHIGK